MKADRTYYPYGSHPYRVARNKGDAPLPLVLTPPPLVVSSRGGLKLAVLLPCRGTVFSLAMESILRECLVQTNYTIAIFFTHGMNIPEAQQNLVKRALAWGAQATWLVEEDNYMPAGVLAELISRHTIATPWSATRRGLAYPVVSCSYYDHDGCGWVVPEWGHRMAFHAFGCTLVHRTVWEAIGAPYVSRGKLIHFTASGTPYEDATKFYPYGGQDVKFSFDLYQRGISSHRLDGKRWRCGHLHVERQGDRASNATGASTVVMM